MVRLPVPPLPHEGCKKHFVQRGNEQPQKSKSPSLLRWRWRCRRWSRRRRSRSRRSRGHRRGRRRFGRLRKLLQYGTAGGCRGRILVHRQRHGRQHEHDRAPRRGLGKKGGGSARAEGRLAARAAEGAGEVRRFPALQHDDHDQKSANDHVQRNQHKINFPAERQKRQPYRDRNCPFYFFWQCLYLAFKNSRWRRRPLRSDSRRRPALRRFPPEPSIP